MTVGDVSGLAPTVYVLWDLATRTEVTDDLSAISVRHGAANRSNPDRPTVGAARGSLTLAAAPDPAHRHGRHPVIVQAGRHILWRGWIQEPDAVPGPRPATRWQLRGRLDERLSQQADVSRPASTVADTLADAELWTRLVGGPVTAAAVEQRALKPIMERGRTGGFVSRFAATSSTLPVERRDGTLRFASPTPSAPPPAALLSSAAMLIAPAVETIDRADRIRNQGTVTVPDIPGAVTDRELTDVEVRADAPSDISSLIIAGDVQLAVDGSVSDVRVVTDTAMQWLVAGEVLTLWDVYEQPPTTRFAYNYLHSWQWVDGPAVPDPTVAVAGLTASISQTIAAFADQPYQYRWRYIYSTPGFAPGVGHSVFASPAGTVHDVEVGGTVEAWGSRLIEPTGEYLTGGVPAAARWAPPEQNRAYGARRLVRVLYTHTAPAVVNPPRVTENAASIARWGLRPLQLPDWLAADTDLQSEIDRLAVLRREHHIRIPVLQGGPGQDAAAALDAGDYVALRLHDPDRGVDIDEICLVAGREITWRAGSELVVALRCLEVGGRAYSAGYSRGYD